MSRLVGGGIVGAGGALARAIGAGELARREGFNQDGRGQDGDGGKGEDEVESHIGTIGTDAPDISFGRLCCVVRRVEEWVGSEGNCVGLCG